MYKNSFHILPHVLGNVSRQALMFFHEKVEHLRYSCISFSVALGLLEVPLISLLQFLQFWRSILFLKKFHPGGPFFLLFNDELHFVPLYMECSYPYPD